MRVVRGHYAGYFDMYKIIRRVNINWGIHSSKHITDGPWNSKVKVSLTDYRAQEELQAG